MSEADWTGQRENRKWKKLQLGAYAVSKVDDSGFDENDGRRCWIRST